MERAQHILEEEMKLREKTEAVFLELIKTPEITETLQLLDKLPGHLKYHNKAHTLDVIFETILFAVADNVSPEIIKLQAISAAWHDTGFIEQDKDNEKIAVSLFEASEVYKTLSESERKEVIANIWDTQVVLKDEAPFLLKQQSELAYALDGDVSNFGREDFFDLRTRVAEELGLARHRPAQPLADHGTHQRRIWHG